MTARSGTTRLAPQVLGMALFISSETMFFGGLFAAYFGLRATAPGAWPPESTPEVEALLPAAATLALVVSSVTAHRAVRAAERGDAATAIRWVQVTMGLGIAFLAAQGIELAGLGFSLAGNLFETTFLTMTGFHGLHVAGGLVAFTLALERLRSTDAAHARGTVDAVGYYWHFVDVVWVLLFSVLYLIR